MWAPKYTRVVIYGYIIEGLLVTYTMHKYILVHKNGVDGGDMSCLSCSSSETSNKR